MPPFVGRDHFCGMGRVFQDVVFLVCRTFDNGRDFRMNAFRIVSCREAETGEEVPVSQDGAILAEPGSYLLKVRQ